MELKVGRCYRAKKPAIAGGSFVNDRQIKWLGEQTLQYDGPSVANGRQYPTVKIEDFLKWADRDVTDDLPEGDWQLWIGLRPSEPTEPQEAGR